MTQSNIAQGREQRAMPQKEASAAQAGDTKQAQITDEQTAHPVSQRRPQLLSQCQEIAGAASNRDTVPGKGENTSDMMKSQMPETGSLRGESTARQRSETHGNQNSGPARTREREANSKAVKAPETRGWDG
jgi:hypothetical protein